MIIEVNERMQLGHVSLPNGQGLDVAMDGEQSSARWCSAQRADLAGRPGLAGRHARGTSGCQRESNGPRPPELSDVAGPVRGFSRNCGRLELPAGDYAVFGSGPLTVRGIIPFSNDLDVLCGDPCLETGPGRSVTLEHLPDYDVDIVTMLDGDSHLWDPVGYR